MKPVLSVESSPTSDGGTTYTRSGGEPNALLAENGSSWTPTYSGVFFPTTLSKTPSHHLCQDSYATLPIVGGLDPNRPDFVQPSVLQRPGWVENRGSGRPQYQGRRGDFRVCFLCLGDDHYLPERQLGAREAKALARKRFQHLTEQQRTRLSGFSYAQAGQPAPNRSRSNSPAPPVTRRYPDDRQRTGPGNRLVAFEDYQGPPAKN